MGFRIQSLGCQTACPKVLSPLWDTGVAEGLGTLHTRVVITFELIQQTRFPSKPLIIRVPFFLMFRFTKEIKRKKGTTGAPTLPETNMETQKGPYKDHSPSKRGLYGFPC